MRLDQNPGITQQTRISNTLNGITTSLYGHWSPPTQLDHSRSDRDHRKQKHKTKQRPRAQTGEGDGRSMSTLRRLPTADSHAGRLPNSEEEEELLLSKLQERNEITPPSTKTVKPRRSSSGHMKAADSRNNECWTLPVHEPGGGESRKMRWECSIQSDGIEDSIAPG